MKFKRFLYWLYWTITYLPLRLIYPTRIVNKKAFRTQGRVIYAANHTSNLDPFIFKSHQHKFSYVVAKHTLWNNKFTAHILNVTGGIPVNRQDVGVSTIKKVLEVLNSDQSLLIFPEGKRVHSLEDTEALKNGMAMFAAKTNAVIVPAVFYKKPRPFVFNKIIVGDPISIEEYMVDGKVPREKYSEISNKVLSIMHTLQEKKPRVKRARAKKAS